MTTITLELDLNIDETQCTKEAIIEAVAEILDAHGDGCYSVSSITEKEIV